MASVTCPACSSEMKDRADTCPKCGYILSAPNKPHRAAIGSLSGKFKATGAVIVTLAVIATVSGFWWGPALFLPGVAVFMFGMAD